MTIEIFFSLSLLYSIAYSIYGRRLLNIVCTFLIKYIADDTAK